MDFLERTCGKTFSIISLTGDGSSRSYSRVINRDKTFILCRDINYREFAGEDYPFFIVHGLFENAGLPVPRVYEHDRNAGLILQQDLGDVMLEEYAASISRENLLDLYRKILISLSVIQSIQNDGSVPFNLSFDREKLLFEFDFFIVHALTGYTRRKPDQGLVDELRNEFEKITDILQRKDLFVLNHRDFHSRNIMIHDGCHYVIDFQDARMGLPQYDLSSLLRDSYTRLDDAMYESLVDFYFKESRNLHNTDLERDEYDYYMDIMAFQRNVKAMGSFGWLAGQGKGWFEKYIMPTESYLAGYAGRRKELRKAWSIIHDVFNG